MADQKNGTEVATLVNVTKHPYNKYFINALQGSGKEPLSTFVEKGLADKVMQEAADRNVVIAYTSLYRDPKEYGTRHPKDDNVDNSQHSALGAIDFKAAIPIDVYNAANKDLSQVPMMKGDEGSAEEQIRKQSMVKFATDIQKNPNNKDVRWGGNFSVENGQKYATVTYQDAGGNFVTKTINASEFWHLDRKGAFSSEDLDGAHSAMKAKSQQLIKSNTPPISADTITIYKNGNKYSTVITESNQQAEVTASKNSSKYATEFKEQIGLEGNAKQVSFKELKSGERLTRIPNGQYKYAGYINPKTPRNLANGGEPTVKAINIDVQQLNNIRDVNINEIQAKSTLNKLRRNVTDGHTPFGHELKQDGAPVAIKLILDKLFESERSGSSVAKWDALKAAGADYIDCFFLERMSRISEERYQIIQSISEEYKVYFSGKTPETVRFSGKVINTYNQQWAYDFEYLYDNFLRGSKAVENRIRAFMTVADRIYEILILKLGLDGDGNFDSVNTFMMEAIILQKIEVGEYSNPLVRSGAIPESLTSGEGSISQVEMSKKAQEVIAQGQATATTGELTGNKVADNLGPTIRPDQFNPKDFLSGKGYQIINPDGAITEVQTPASAAARWLQKNTAYANSIKHALNSSYPSDTRLKEDGSQDVNPVLPAATVATSNLNNKYPNAKKVPPSELKTAPVIASSTETLPISASTTVSLPFQEGRSAQDANTIYKKNPIDKIDTTVPATSDKQKDLRDQYQTSTDKIGKSISLVPTKLYSVPSSSLR